MANETPTVIWAAQDCVWYELSYRIERYDQLYAVLMPVPKAIVPLSTENRDVMRTHAKAIVEQTFEGSKVTLMDTRLISEDEARIVFANIERLQVSTSPLPNEGHVDV